MRWKMALLASSSPDQPAQTISVPPSGGAEPSGPWELSGVPPWRAAGGASPLPHPASREAASARLIARAASRFHGYLFIVVLTYI